MCVDSMKFAEVGVVFHDAESACTLPIGEPRLDAPTFLFVVAILQNEL